MNHSFLHVIQPGTLKPNKAVDIIGKHISLNPFTAFDLSVLEHFSGHDIKSIYVSFANKSSDIYQLKEHLSRLNYDPNIEIIAKIETIEALQTFQRYLILSTVFLLIGVICLVKFPFLKSLQSIASLACPENVY